MVPLVLGAGERLFTGVADLDLDLLATDSTELVTHLTYRVRH